MNWIGDFVTWLQSVSGWPVYPTLLPDGQNYGVVYEAEEEGDPAHDEEAPGAYGPVQVTLFVYHERLSQALSKARDIVHNLADIATADGYLRGGQVVSQETGQEPLADLYFVMVRVQYRHQE